MGGGLMQLVAYGAQDTYLTGNPQITFFKIVYRRHTNFSMETIRQTINGDTRTDTVKENRGSVIISRNGDLLSKIYVTSSTVGITDGLEIVKEVSIDIGGQEIDRFIADFLFLYYMIKDVKLFAKKYWYIYPLSYLLGFTWSILYCLAVRIGGNKYFNYK